MIPPVNPSEDCLRARASVSARLDGELSELGSVRLAAHLQACPECAAYALELTAIAERLRAAPLVPPQQRFVLTRRSRVSGVRAGAAAAVAVVAAMLVVVGGIARQQSEPGASATPAVAQLSTHHLQAEERLVALLASLNATPLAREGRLIPL